MFVRMMNKRKDESQLKSNFDAVSHVISPKKEDDEENIRPLIFMS